MPYVFSDWEHCTDPSGNARTLDWSEEGMRGQPPGLYLEALRQAAAQRAAVAGGYVHPGLTHEVVPMHGFVGIPKLDDLGDFLGLDMLLWYIEMVAWAQPGYTTAGWVNPAAVADIAGSTDLTGAMPPPMNTTAALLAAIGEPARLPPPTTIVGGIPGAYLRQLRAVFRKQTIYQAYVEVSQSSGHFYRRTTGDLSPPLTWAAVEAAYAAASWVDDGTWTGAPWYRPSSGLTRRARRVRFVINGSQSCKHVTAYIYAQKWTGDAYFNPDHPHLLENTWCKHLDDVALTDNEGDFFYKADTAGPQPPGWPDTVGTSYIRGMASRCDYREDFTLAG